MVLVSYKCRFLLSIGFGCSVHLLSQLFVTFFSLSPLNCLYLVCVDISLCCHWCCHLRSCQCHGLESLYSLFVLKLSSPLGLHLMSYTGSIVSAFFVDFLLGGAAGLVSLRIGPRQLGSLPPSAWLMLVQSVTRQHCCHILSSLSKSMCLQLLKPGFLLTVLILSRTPVLPVLLVSTFLGSTLMVVVSPSSSVLLSRLHLFWNIFHLDQEPSSIYLLCSLSTLCQSV